MGMFDDINKVQLLGNATADPEIKYTPSGTALANVNMAMNRSYKVGEEWKKETTFIRVVFWGKLAEQIKERVSKGTRMLIDGRIQVSSWDNNEGKKQYKTEIVANDFILIDRFNKKSEGNSAEYDNKSPESDDQSIDPSDLPF